MKTFVSTGEKIDVLAPADITAGAGILIGSMFGIAQNTALSGKNLVVITRGEVDMAKAGSQAWTLGVKVYWDNSAKVATTTASGNTLIGVATKAVGSGAGETIGRVRLGIVA